MKTRLAILSLAVAFSALPSVSLAADPMTAAGQASGHAERPTFVGVELIPVDAPTRTLFKLPEAGGLLVIGIAPGSPAEGRLGQGDILLKLDDQMLVNREQLRALVRARKAGESADFTVSRGGRETRVSVKLAPAPEGLAGPSWGEVFPLDPRRYEDLMGKLTERTRRMLEDDCPGHVSHHKTSGDVSVSIGGDGVRIVTTRTWSRPEGDVTVVYRDGKKTVTVKGADGKVLAEGEFDDALRAKLPAWARETLESKSDPKVSPPPAPKAAAKPSAPLARDAMRLSRGGEPV